LLLSLLPPLQQQVLKLLLDLLLLEKLPLHPDCCPRLLPHLRLLLLLLLQWNLLLSLHCRVFYVTTHCHQQSNLHNPPVPFPQSCTLCRLRRHNYHHAQNSPRSPTLLPNMKRASQSPRP
jgi:hypothetical protein